MLYFLKLKIGYITTIAGTVAQGTASTVVQNPLKAKLNHPSGIAFDDTTGKLYFIQEDAHIISVLSA
jgi:DNA-binding beta-propeller fold protein YncE